MDRIAVFIFIDFLSACILVFKEDYYSIFIMVSVLLAAGGAISLTKAIRKERRSVHEQGGESDH